MAETIISKQHILAVDLGQAQDFTAITDIEKVEINSDDGRLVRETGIAQSKFEPPTSMQVVNHTRQEFHVRHLQRLKLGTVYPEQIRIIGALFNALPRAQEKPALVADSTGVGLPIIQAMRESGLQPISVVITGGFDENRISRVEYRVPKRNLISNLAVALESGRLKIAPELAEAEAFVNELLNFKMKISASGHDTYEAWRESIHDDYLLSVAIGLYIATRQPKPMRVIRGGVHYLRAI